MVCVAPFAFCKHVYMPSNSLFNALLTLHITSFAYMEREVCNLNSRKMACAYSRGRNCVNWHSNPDKAIGPLHSNYHRGREDWTAWKSLLHLRVQESEHQHHHSSIPMCADYQRVRQMHSLGEKTSLSNSRTRTFCHYEFVAVCMDNFAHPMRIGRWAVASSPKYGILVVL